MSIHLIIGCMFSGKTTELLRQINRHKIANKKVLTIKSDLDDRYHKTDITSHDKKKGTARAVSTLMPLIDELEQYDVIAIDEGQFFKDLLTFCESAATKLNKKIIVAALDSTFDRKPFTQVTNLVAYAEKVEKLSAICTNCGKEAFFSKRIDNNKEKILIGSNDSYVASCRICHQVP